MSKIEWTERTWNPIRGCLKVSPGCQHCYAIRFANRLEKMGITPYEGTTKGSGSKTNWTGKITFDEATLQKPLHWRKPAKIFVNSMGDLFATTAPYIDKVWQVMMMANWHQYQILTKRPQVMRDYVWNVWLLGGAAAIAPHIWLGVSVENRDYLSRIDILRETPAKIRFISFEPLIGSVGQINLEGIHWVIVGGESGSGARVMKAKWVEEIQQQCREAKVAFFFKQWGGVRRKEGNNLWLGRLVQEYPYQNTETFFNEVAIAKV